MPSELVNNKTNELKTVRVSLSVEKVIIDSLDKYIENGDGWDIIPEPDQEKTCQTIDISRSGLIRYLIS